jgi:hypothetical protein
MSNPSTGWRKLARPGNAGQRLFYEVRNLPPAVYYWSVQAVDVSFAGSAFATEQILYYGVANDDPQTSPIVRVSNHPNPFASSTMLNVDIKQAGPTRIAIYNLKGQLIRVLNDSSLSSGQHSFNWNGRDEDGKDVASGIYSARVESGDQIIYHKMMIIK